MAEHYYGCEIALEDGQYVVRKDGVRRAAVSTKTQARKWARVLDAAAKDRAGGSALPTSGAARPASPTPACKEDE